MRNEVKFLKKEIERMTKELGVSKSFFKRTTPTVSGAGYSYSVAKQNAGGHKASLRQQYAILKDLLDKNEEMKEMFTKKKDAQPVDNVEKVNNMKMIGSFFNTQTSEKKE